jgi:hypothetical protein
MRPLLILPALAFLGTTAFAQSAPATTPQKLPFTISKETTRITAPLRPDGTVDYLAALNQKYSQGVTPENNGFVLWLQLTGTGEHVIDPKGKKALLKMCGAADTPPGALVWESYADYVYRTKPVAEATPIAEVIVPASKGPWRAKDHPDLASFLMKQEKLLTLAGQAVERPRWWVPSITDGRTALSALIPSLGLYRDVALALSARALLRAANGDIDACLADIRTVRRLARRVAGNLTLIDRLVGTAIEFQATAALAAVASGGSLTNSQCVQAGASFAELGPLSSFAESVDVPERFMNLDLLQWIAIGQGKQLNFGTEGELADKPPAFDTIDQQAMNWNLVFKQDNAAFDDLVAMMRLPRLSDLRSAVTTFEKRYKSDPEEAARGWRNFHRLSDEPPAAYAQRVSRVFMHNLVPTFENASMLERRADQQTQMARLLLAAAQFKARTGHWPATLADLVPAYIKDLPKDIYSPDDAPVRYLLTPAGPRIYSIGTNARDDHGLHDSPDHDDLAIGTP